MLGQMLAGAAPHTCCRPWGKAAMHHSSCRHVRCISRRVLIGGVRQTIEPRGPLRQCSRLSRFARQATDGGSNYREDARRLTKLFYQPEQEAVPAASDATPGLCLPYSGVSKAYLHDVPLWRVEWALLPGMQQMLHVHVPHYVHMFESVFHRGRPWLFGHLYLPDGSRNLGNPEYALRPGTKAPMVGVLMEITRAVRLLDGRLLILATAVGRFKVLRSLQESPFSRADVMIYPDSEEYRDMVEEVAMQALADQPVSDDFTVPVMMQAAEFVALAATAAAAFEWQEYELAVPRAHQWATSDGPCTADTDSAIHQLVQELVQHGVREVTPLPNGAARPGRWNLLELSRRAHGAAVRAARAAAEMFVQLSSGEEDDNGEGWDSGAAAAPRMGTGVGFGPEADSQLNTLSARGVPVQAAELDEAELGLKGLGGLEDVLRLEELVWQELDAVASLVLRVRRQALGLPSALLQLRPPPQGQGPLSPSLTTSGHVGGTAAGEEAESAADPSLGHRPASYHQAASEGAETCADPAYPVLRRAARLSFYAHASLMDLSPSEGRQAVLEATGVASRLKMVLAILLHHRKVLAALAAVRGLRDQDGSGAEGLGR